MVAAREMNSPTQPTPTQHPPMIHKVSGDILLTRAQVIAHGVAPNDDFHSGLALALREEWPALYKDFRHFLHQQHPDPGGLWMWGGTNGLRIVNLFTQEPAPHAGAHAGRATTGHVNHALRALHKLAEKEKFTSIALPRLATGVGGLEWSEVAPLIEHHLSDLDIPVIVYENFVAGQRAEEPLPEAAAV